MASDDGDGWHFPMDAPINNARYTGVRSPLKFCVLDFASGQGTITYHDLAEYLDMPTEYACDRLCRYARNGLLTRDRDGDGGLSVFELTDGGRQRLRYFRGVSSNP